LGENITGYPFNPSFGNGNNSRDFEVLLFSVVVFCCNNLTASMQEYVKV
jgi:hypothetical protein